MIVKVSEATGTILDWMVARALGKRPSMFIFQQTGLLAAEHNYSTNPAQAYPIIFVMGIGTGFDSFGNRWIATIDGGAEITYGPTPLIAAMRCFVVSKLDTEVEVPDEFK